MNECISSALNRTYISISSEYGFTVSFQWIYKQIRFYSYPHMSRDPHLECSFYIVVPEDFPKDTNVQKDILKNKKMNKKVFMTMSWSIRVFPDFVLFCRGPNPSKVLQQLLMLQPEQQLSIFHTLHSHLRERGMLPQAEWELAGWWLGSVRWLWKFCVSMCTQTDTHPVCVWSQASVREPIIILPALYSTSNKLKITTLDLRWLSRQQETSHLK